MATKLTEEERYRRANLHLSNMRAHIRAIDSGSLTPRERGSTFVRARGCYNKIYGELKMLTRPRGHTMTQINTAARFIDNAHAEFSACWKRHHK